jgi:hypothetical protein
MPTPLSFLEIELKDWVAIAALLVSATVPSVLFFLGRRRGTKSDQTYLSGGIWDRINSQYNIIKEWSFATEWDRQSKEGRIDFKRSLVSLRNELKLFVKLVEIGEIKEDFLREYYQGGAV